MKVGIWSEGYGDTSFSPHVSLWMEKSTLMCYVEVQFNYTYVGLHYWYSPLLDVTMIPGEWQSGVRQVHRHCLLGYVRVSPATGILISTVSRVEGSFSSPFAGWHKELFRWKLLASWRSLLGHFLGRTADFGWCCSVTVCAHSNSLHCVCLNY